MVRIMHLVKQQGQQPWLRLIVGAAIAFWILGIVLNLHRYYTFYASYDQGIFNQVFWNGLHGHFFQSSLSSALSTNVVHNGEVPTVVYHRLGQHFTPSLLLWLPFYGLWPSPATLSVLQVTLATAAGLVLYGLARQRLASPLASLITLSFYGANAVVGPTWGNFHDFCQIPLFVFGLLLALEKRWWWLFSLLAVLIPLVREDTGIILFGVGVYLVVSQRRPRLGLALSSGSFLYMMLLTNTIMPLFSADISRRFMLERFGQYTTGDEASTLEIIGGMVGNPGRLMRELVSPPLGTLKYLLGQWLPLAFVPAIAPAAWALAGFPLLKLLLAKGMSVLAINIRYAMAVVPGLFYGTVLWWSENKIKLRLNFQRFWVTCIALSLFFTLISNPNRTLSFIIPDSIQPWVFVPLHQQWQHASKIRPLLHQIPKNASVSATTYLIPHLSSRREVLRLPALRLQTDQLGIIWVEYAIADLWQLATYAPAFHNDWNTLVDLVQLIDRVTMAGDYGLVEVNDGVVLLQRGKPSDPQAVANWQAFHQSIVPLLTGKELEPNSLF